jgi:hypothetical protein
MISNLKTILVLFQGKIGWAEINYKKKTKHCHYVIFCMRKERELAKCYIRNIQQYINNKYIENPAIITDDQEVFTECQKYKECAVVYMATAKLNNIISYYLFRKLKKKVIVVSLNEPFGSYGLVHSGKVNVKEMIMSYIW